ncbi:hypothetical protein Poli38472_011345 [Pythium oligandrum]|uniref:Uncharacterized protein n=1 Tax=Pythium oligandrum TaxID=41045 RepID=A0A8K1CJL9_PYTOL|nr:hypothetical protein Poli38472_011345 [Pythium oligandrum]|eukprot:TMW64465.1 hypothetical protein Poli38472_011345 [Pythium oligandrum]
MEVPTEVNASTRRAAQPRRVFHTLRRMELTGSTLGGLSEHVHEGQWQRTGARTRFQSVADLPKAFVDHLNREDGREYERQTTFNGYKRSFAHLIREIYDIVDGVNYDKKQLRRILHEIVQRVLEPNVVHGPLHGNASDAVLEFVTTEREKFLCMGGAECLLRVIHSMRIEEEQHQRERMTSANATKSSVPVLDLGRQQHRRNVLDRNDVRSLWEAPSVQNTQEAPPKGRHETGTRKAILNDAMGILRELCYFSLPLAKQLCDKDGLIVYLFELMEDNKFFDNAAGLVEEILAVREDSFDLSRISRFHEIVQSFSSRQLAFFCRVLALVVFEPEDRRLLETSKVIKSMELLKLRRSRMLRADNIVDRNHAMIFNSEIILSRLLTVLQVQNFYFAVNPVYEPFSNELATSAEFAMLLSQTSDRSDWEAIDRLMGHQYLTGTSEFSVLRHGHRNGGAGATHEHHHDHDHHHHHHHHSPFSMETAILRDLIFRNRSPDQRAREDVEAQVIMKSIVLAPYRVEVLFVLCTLLNGKRKIDFQDRLAAMGLVKTLNTMFDKFQWHSTPPANSQAPLHGPGCGCSLDASLKIQFLRLIHNFCDRDYSDNTSKLLLLSETELRMLREPDTRPIDLTHSDKGLLCKIIHTLIGQPADSIYRFWLSSCVEAFLRRAAPNEQLFVARTPLLKSLITEILSGGGYRAQGSFQSAFDLLGEMTKGNRQTLQLFHRMLDSTQFASFMEVVIRNLVDSNVFVRSMLLSAEKFDKSPMTGTFGMAEDFEMDRMSEFLAVNVVRLLKDLMTVVTLDDVNHENICCLNTAIVILLFQHRRKRLPVILDALRSHEDMSGKAGYVCVNFRALLWFWIQYYTPRGRDRLSLEHSSDIKFEEWRDVVALLCADDGSATALLNAPMRLPASPYSRFYASLLERNRQV